MKICTFFGHRDAPESIRYDLKQVLIDLIENKGVSWFYVGHNGKFDSMVLTELKLFSTVYKHIHYFVAVAGSPDKKLNIDADNEHLVYVDVNLNSTPKKFEIDRRNGWMINQSDYVVTYVWKTWGGAHKFKEIAEKKNKTVINLHKEQ